MAETMFSVPSGSTLYVPVLSYNSSGASSAMTGLAVTDIEIYKNGSTTQRSSDNGYTLLDTDGLDIDSVTGLNGFSIDLSDNSDAGFYAVGSQYWVVVSTVTVDSQTVTFLAAWFRIVAAEGITGKPKVDVDGFGGSAGTFASGIPEVKVASIAANAITATAIASDAITAAKIATDAIDADAIAADAVTEIQNGLATAAALDAVDNFVDTEVAAIKAKTDNLPSDPADASDIAALLTAIDDFVDTEVAAIKAKTDSLTFTQAGQVDANIQYVNNVQVNGTGASGDEWGP